MFRKKKKETTKIVIRDFFLSLPPADAVFAPATPAFLDANAENAFDTIDSWGESTLAPEEKRAKTGAQCDNERTTFFSQSLYLLFFFDCL